MQLQEALQIDDAMKANEQKDSEDEYRMTNEEKDTERPKNDTKHANEHENTITNDESLIHSIVSPVKNRTSDSGSEESTNTKDHGIPGLQPGKKKKKKKKKNRREALTTKEIVDSFENKTAPKTEITRPRSITNFLATSDKHERKRR